MLYINQETLARNRLHMTFVGIELDGEECTKCMAAGTIRIELNFCGSTSFAMVKTWLKKYVERSCESCWDTATICDGMV